MRGWTISKYFQIPLLECRILSCPASGFRSRLYCLVKQATSLHEVQKDPKGFQKFGWTSVLQHGFIRSHAAVDCLDQNCMCLFPGIKFSLCLLQRSTWRNGSIQSPIANMLFWGEGGKGEQEQHLMFGSNCSFVTEVTTPLTACALWVRRHVFSCGYGEQERSQLPRPRYIPIHPDTMMTTSVWNHLQSRVSIRVWASNEAEQYPGRSQTCPPHTWRADPV